VVIYYNNKIEKINDLQKLFMQLLKWETYLIIRHRLEVIAKSRCYEAKGLPYLVAKVPTADNMRNVDVDKVSFEMVRAQRESKGVGAALLDAQWEIPFESFFGPVNLILVQVTLL
jgi:hypothetical protein